MIQCSFGNTWSDYYVDARNVESAIKKATKMFKAEFKIASSFIKAVA
jgi:hypothetical protein